MQFAGRHLKGAQGLRVWWLLLSHKFSTVVPSEWLLNVNANHANQLTLYFFEFAFDLLLNLMVCVLNLEQGLFQIQIVL